MGFGSAGSKQRTDHIHPASSLCIAFPLWPPSVPLCPGSFPRRCGAAVHAQSSSHHSVIPLRLGAQLPTVSHVQSSCCRIQAACCTHFAWQHSFIIMCIMSSLQQQVNPALLLWQCNAQSNLYSSILLLLLWLARPQAGPGGFLQVSVCLLFVQCVASTNIRLCTCICTCTCRPYLYTAIISAAVTVPFLLVKASIFDRPSYHPPAVFLFLDFLGFSLLHILVARKVVGWARNRYKLGLLGQSHPWQVGTLRCVMTNAQVPESVRPCVAWLMVTKHCVTVLQFLTL